MLPFIEKPLKNAALEVQEYVRLVAATFHGIFTRPRYRHDIVEQFDVIGVGSLTVVHPDRASSPARRCVRRAA